MKSHPIQVVEASPIKIHRMLEGLLTAVRGCRACDAHLPLGPRPVVQVGTTARILVVGQAPGAKVHGSGVSWDDKSGERLRDWMGMIPRPSMTRRESRSCLWVTATPGAL